MALRSLDLGAPELGCLLASLLGERDIIRQGPEGPVVNSADTMLRLQALAVYARERRMPLRSKDDDEAGEDQSGITPLVPHIGFLLVTPIGFPLLP